MNRLGRWITRMGLHYFARLDPPASALNDLPLVEIAAKPRAPRADTLAIFFSGDGGWTVINRAISHGLSCAGIPVIGFNSLRYFWSARQPDGAAADLARIARHYLEAWSMRRLLLIGYSRGAGVLPFMIHHLPGPLRERVRMLVLLAPGRAEEFEVRIRDYFEDLLEHLHHWGMVGDHFDLPDTIKAAPADGARPILPEVERLRGLPMLLVHGSKEKHSLAGILPEGLARSIQLPGGHHFNRDYPALARMIVEALNVIE